MKRIISKKNGTAAQAAGKNTKLMLTGMGIATLIVCAFFAAVFSGARAYPLSETTWVNTIRENIQSKAAATAGDSQPVNREGENAPAEPVSDDNLPGTWDTIRMKVTAYCPCARCCGKHADGITANGHHIRWGDKFVAADKMFRFGRKVIIPGYNDGRPVEVRDRGSAIKGYHIDVFFNSHARAKRWGVKYLYVKIKR
jgi:3D (Asp-Asp-Asp) domain-containing protein